MSGFFGRVFGAFTSRGQASGAKLQDVEIEDDDNNNNNNDNNNTKSNNKAGNMPVHEAAAGGKNPMKRLFEEDDDDEGAGGFGKASSFTINEEYAKRYEYNKKREEKQKRKLWSRPTSPCYDVSCLFERVRLTQLCSRGKVRQGRRQRQ